MNTTMNGTNGTTTTATPLRKRGRPLCSKPPVKTVSREAKQRAAAILEVLAGGRTPTEAAQVLGVSQARYYLLEERAMHGLLVACEPQPRGPGANPARECDALRQEVELWKREHARQQSLVRAAQRTIGLAPPPTPIKNGKDAKQRRRKRKPVVRALQRAERLRQEPLEPQETSTAAPEMG